MPDGLRAWRNAAKDWVDVTDRAIPADWRPTALPDPFQAAAAGDLDGDGDTDLVVRTQSGRVLAARNRGGDKLASLSVRLIGRVSNRSAVGASVEMRAGSLWQKLEVTSTSPPIAATGLVFGLGRRTQADVLRVLWPSGVLQAEPVAAPTGRTAALELTELDRKPSSCPFLYTWNGTRFEFLTDFMGGGEMGYLYAPGVRGVPDPDEYVRIPGDRLVPRAGRIDLRVTNELEETTFVDRLQLSAVTHPRDVAIFPSEGLKSPPYVATLDVARHVKINSTGNDTGRIFTITGTDRYGKVITENITGPNLAVGGESTKNFKTVTVVHIDGDPPGDITVRTNGKMEGPWLPVDYDREMTTVNVNVGGVSTIEHKVQHTVGNPFGANDALTAVDFYTAQTAEKTATVTQNIRAVRIVFTAFTGYCCFNYNADKVLKWDL